MADSASPSKPFHEIKTHLVSAQWLQVAIRRLMVDIAPRNNLKQHWVALLASCCRDLSAQRNATDYV